MLNYSEVACCLPLRGSRTSFLATTPAVQSQRRIHGNRLLEVEVHPPMASLCLAMFNHVSEHHWLIEHTNSTLSMFIEQKKTSSQQKKKKLQDHQTPIVQTCWHLLRRSKRRSARPSRTRGSSTRTHRKAENKRNLRNGNGLKLLSSNELYGQRTGGFHWPGTTR